MMPVARVGVGRNHYQAGNGRNKNLRESFVEDYSLINWELGRPVQAKQGKGVKTFSFQFHTYTGCDLTGKSYILIYQTSLIFSPNTCMPSTNASENPSSACKVV